MQTILGFLIGITFTIVILFQPIETYSLQVRHQSAEKIVNKYLTRIKLDGYLTTVDENKMINEFANIGCPIENKDTDIIVNARESRGDTRILRNTDPTAGEVFLTVKCKLDPKPAVPNAPETLMVGGTDYSERPDP
ncbi:conserved hypothetical protein [Desulforamulus reducens MI-1]|uniref:Type II secretion system protein n=1 Tax=Desulforamulus reducens (strain ATCC BAA-1160 / DSM 100696 / MI-1) TaxID=349161 RepID=A4J2R5_DESRM|nr:hypothetical protein [Desulforamulus reducens]ABO49368.1 conserved hypothetical protein [Desulforamulus reducens MI-1]